MDCIWRTTAWSGEWWKKRTMATGHGTAMVFTFSNHPLSVLAPPYAPKTLLTQARKQEILENMGWMFW
jgi:FAD synthase